MVAAYIRDRIQISLPKKMTDDAPFLGKFEIRETLYCVGEPCATRLGQSDANRRVHAALCVFRDCRFNDPVARREEHRFSQLVQRPGGILK